VSFKPPPLSLHHALSPVINSSALSGSILGGFLVRSLIGEVFDSLLAVSGLGMNAASDILAMVAAVGGAPSTSPFLHRWFNFLLIPT
jgi:hypothetical protein